MTRSEPRASVTKYTIFPRGYDEASLGDAYHFCIYVEQFIDSRKWRIHDGYTRGGQVVTHKGNWVWDTPLNRQWTRFESADEALEIALVAVDNHPTRTNLIDAEKRLTRGQ